MIKNQWYAILPSNVVKSGQVIGVKRCNLNLILFRNEKKQLSCLVDKCSHRGAALSKGSLKNGCLKCPFHGIEFDLKGQCQFIPALGKENQSDLSRFNIEEYIVKEESEIIYLWYGDKEKITDSIPFFYDYLDSSYKYSELKDHWNTHYSRAIENQLDVVHLPFVHHNTIGRGNKTLVNGPKVVFINEIMRTSADNEVDLGQKPKPAQDAKIKKTHLNFLFPNIWMNHISEKIKVLIYFAPVDEENTILYIRFYNKITSIGLFDAFISFIGKYANKIVERQDKRIVITQRPKSTGLGIGENLIKGDKPIMEYRLLRNQLKKK